MGMSEGAFLRLMKQKASEQKKAPGPTKSHKPKVTRMQSLRMVRIERTATSDMVRASYQDTKKAAQGCIVGEPEYTTREVGPGDRFNRTNDYTMGKDTVSRKA